MKRFLKPTGESQGTTERDREFLTRTRERNMGTVVIMSKAFQDADRPVL